MNRLVREKKKSVKYVQVLRFFHGLLNVEMQKLSRPATDFSRCIKMRTWMEMAGGEGRRGRF